MKSYFPVNKTGKRLVKVLETKKRQMHCVNLNQIKLPQEFERVLGLN